MDDALRRQLRFSVFLQVAAAAMFGVAFVARLVTTGFDGLTAVFLVATLLPAAAAGYFISRLRAR